MRTPKSRSTLWAIMHMAASGHSPLPDKWYRIGARTMALVTTLLARWEVLGREQVPSRGPYTVVANHWSFLDPPLLAASLPRPVTFMAKAELWNLLPSRLFCTAIGLIPLRRGEVDRGAIARALEVMKAGGALALFPEGTRGSGQTVGLKPGRRGAALLASLSGAPIVPVGIWGTEQIPSLSDLPKKVFSRPQLTVNIGQPFFLPETNGTPSSEELTAATEAIMLHIAKLLPARYHGVYARPAVESQLSL